MLKIDERGNRFWYDAKGKFHRVNGPAIEYVNGTKCWYLDDKRHRVDGPAVERANRTRHWYQNSKRHRIDGPAIEWSDGSKAWWLNDEEYSEEAYKEKVGEIC
jgi:hypothetical protein